MNRRLPDVLLATFIAICLFGGGASAPGPLGLLAAFFVQMYAIGLIAFALLSNKSTNPIRMPWPLRLAAALMTVLAMLQYVPLPSQVLTGLPGREFLENGFQALGITPPWLTLTLSPFDTLASLAWLLPAIAVFVCVWRLPVNSEVIAAVIVIVALSSVPLAAAQVLRGSPSAWYLYSPSSYGQGSGFFSNANHQASFLLISIALLCGWFAGLRSRASHVALGLKLAFAAALFFLIIGVVLAASMAGAGLLLVVLPSSLLILAPRVNLPRITILAPLGLALVALVIVLSSYGPDLTGTALQATGSMSRTVINAATLKAAWSYFPIGSGIGTFADVYPMYENPYEVTSTFVNHAHDDYVEILLETGLLGAMAVTLFIFWWARKSSEIWRRMRSNYIGIAGSISIGSVLVHSMVDYPLRTVAVSTVFAFCIGVMSRPSQRAFFSTPYGGYRARSENSPIESLDAHEARA